MSASTLATEVFGALARASAGGALFAAAVWTACRLFPRLPAALRCALWWAACPRDGSFQSIPPHQ